MGSSILFMKTDWQMNDPSQKPAGMQFTHNEEWLGRLGQECTQVRALTPKIEHIRHSQVPIPHEIADENRRR
jgi:hypothetical protein